MNDSSPNVNIARVNGTAVDGTGILVKMAGGGGGGPATIADGADVDQGTTTDAAIVSDANGTLSGKLRGLVKIFSDIWDSGNHRANVAVQNIPHVIVDTAPTTAVTLAVAPSTPVTGTFFQTTQPVSITPLGQAASVASVPVVLASDQIVSTDGQVTQKLLMQILQSQRALFLMQCNQTGQFIPVPDVLPFF